MKALFEDLELIGEHRLYGRVAGVRGLLMEVAGIHRELPLGARLEFDARGGRRVPGEVVGFRDGRVLAMPIGELDGLGMGCKAFLGEAEARIFPDTGWLGRVVNGLGAPIDGKGPLPRGPLPRAIRATPPPAHLRGRVGARLDVGVRAINTFATCCRGQRMGIFAGSGVGKSVLLSMLARNTAADVSVIGLIGERGREVAEFIEDHLGPAGLARSVVVVATSDEPALLRRQAAQLTLAIAEFFRDRALDVLCLMDSVTRFAMAEREIGLSLGEPPAAKGYTPSVFAELPRLLERAGPGIGAEGGSITGLFTVLVEGDDHNEPIADAVRGILDGHIVLDRAIAERGRFPAVNVLRSLSRTMPGCNDAGEDERIRHARRLMTVHDDMAELIRIGAYRRGADPAVDEAISRHEALEGFLAQEIREDAGIDEGHARLARLLEEAPGPGDEVAA